jgi:hypothetical protein
LVFPLHKYIEMHGQLNFKKMHYLSFTFMYENLDGFPDN